MKFCRRRFSASSVLDLLKKLLDRRPADLQPRTLRYHGNPHPEMIVRRRKEQLFPRGSSYQWLKGHTESMAAWMLWSKTARRQDSSRVEGLGALEPGQKPTPTWLQGIRSRTGSAEQTDDGGRTRTETQTPNVSFLPETQPRSRETDPTQAPPPKRNASNLHETKQQPGPDDSSLNQSCSLFYYLLRFCCGSEEKLKIQGALLPLPP